MLYIAKEGVRNQKPRWHLYAMDGAGYHMQPSVYRSLQHIAFSMYIGLPNGTAFAHGYNKVEHKSAVWAACGAFFSGVACPHG